MGLRRTLEERKTLVLKEPLIRRLGLIGSQLVGSQGTGDPLALKKTMVITKSDLFKMSRHLKYFSDDLTRRAEKAERLGEGGFMHPTIGLIDLGTAKDMISEARESSEKMEELIDTMVDVGVNEIELGLKLGSK